MGGLLAIIAALVYALSARAWRWQWRRPMTLAQALTRFFGADCREIPIVERGFATVDLPNLHLAIQHEAEARAGSTETLGYRTPHEHPMGQSLRALISGDSPWFATVVGAEQYREVDIGPDERIACLENGLHLLSVSRRKVAVHVTANPFGGTITLELMCHDTDFALQLLDAFRRRASEESVFRGKLLGLECRADEWDESGHAGVRFLTFPAVPDEAVILPAETINLIERNTVRFFAHAEALRRSGRSVKRGLLLHGPPGTGKTYTVMWLAQRLAGTTVIVLSGEQLGLIKQCCAMARALAPAMVVLEDVDLIALERDSQHHAAIQVTLHQLLNEMDGLASDAEVLFMLTTNRPDVLEPALAARPGRIDQAIAYPLPDPDCRARLLDLYGQGLVLTLNDRDGLIGRTEGASPAFIKELLRKGALIAAEEDSTSNGTLKVTDAHLDLALREMILGGGAMSRQLLGFAGDAPAA